MSSSKSVFRYGCLYAAGMLGLACGDAPADKGASGDAMLGSKTEVDPEVAASQAGHAVDECGSDCSADLAAGRDALAKANLTGALEAYKCADTPEAAFGAGIATLLGTVETERADRILKDVGMPHFAAAEVLGKTGYLGRVAARWNGAGSLKITGGHTAQVNLTRVRADGEEVSAVNADPASHVDLSIDSGGDYGAGSSIELEYDCSQNDSDYASSLGGIPGFYLTIENRSEGRIHECRIPYEVPARDCGSSFGAVEFVALGTKAGTKVEIALHDVAMSCYVYDLEWDEVSDPVSVRVDGSVQATVSSSIKTDDLHPLLHEDFEPLLAKVPKDVSVRDFLAHATALTGDLARASCFFDRAAEGSARVFTLPGALLGGDDITFNAGDAKLLAAIAAAGATALQLGATYDLDLSLHDLACLVTDSYDDKETACKTGAKLTDMFNDAASVASVRRDRLEAARVLLTTTLDRFQGAVPLADSMSIFPRNAQSEAGWSAMLKIADALEQSLSKGKTPFPFVSPTVEVDLRSLFAEPVSPADVQGTLLTFEEECDDFECWSSLDYRADYLNELWPSIGVDFGGDYESTDDWDDIEGSLEELETSAANKSTAADDW